MPPSEEPRTAVHGRWLRLGALALAATTLSVALWTGGRDGRDRQALRDDARRLQFADAAVLQRIRFAPDLDLARLAAARVAIDRDLQAIREARPVSLDRLRWAEATAAVVRTRRPRSFEAASTLALARLLILQQMRDPRLYTERGRWEEPLQEALRLAPHEREPRIILLRARLALWFSLSTTERAETSALAKTTFEDPDTFAALMPAWLATHDPWTPGAEQVVPNGARALRSLSYSLAGRGEFDAVARLRRRAAERAPALLAAIGRSRDDAQRLDALAAAPGSHLLADRFSEIVEALSPQALQAAASNDLRNWWNWNVDEASRGRRGLSPAAAERLAYGVGAPDCERALVVVEGEAPAALENAQRLEPPPGVPGGLEPCWHDYLVAKARRLRTRGASPATRAAAESAAQAALELAARIVAPEPKRFELRSDRVLLATRAPARADLRLVLAAGRHGDAQVVDLVWDGWWQTSLAVPPKGVVTARLDLPPAATAQAGVEERTLVVIAVVGGRPQPLSVSFTPAPLPRQP